MRRNISHFIYELCMHRTPREPCGDIYFHVRFINKYISKQIKWKEREGERRCCESSVSNLDQRRREYLNDDRRVLGERRRRQLNSFLGWHIIGSLGRVVWCHNNHIASIFSPFPSTIHHTTISSLSNNVVFAQQHNRYI